jgi:uncharacterized membrane protein YhhN
VSAAAVLAVVAAVAAVGNWIAVARDDKRLEYVCKPLTLAALIGVALLVDSDDPTVRAWFVAGLVLSLAGDVFLMLPRDLFVAGLGSFLLGHVAYIVGLLHADPSAAGLAVGAAVVAVVAAIVGRRILTAVRSGEHPELLAPVAAYILVISVMVVCAIGTGDARAITGAALFYLSDALIAWNRFVRTLPFAPVSIMVTYHLAQAALVLFLL